MTAILATTEDQVFDAIWGFVSSLVDTSVTIVKGFQNMTATPIGSYIVLSPGVKERQNSITRTYDAAGGLMNVERDTVYAYQVDCYGPAAPGLADIVSIAWASLWACDALASAPITPLYADEPTQLNLVNGEFQYEQRFMATLYGQVNTVVSLPVAFGDEATVVVNTPADF